MAWGNSQLAVWKTCKNGQRFTQEPAVAAAENHSRRLQTAGECGADLLLKPDKKWNYHRRVRREGISDYVTECCCWRRTLRVSGGFGGGLRGWVWIRRQGVES